MNIDYYTFKEDCKLIIEPFLAKYGYELNDKIGYKIAKEYENNYVNSNNIVEISMLSNFPHIGVSYSFYPFNQKYIKPSIIDNFFKIDQKDISKLHKTFETRNYINDFTDEMRYAVAVMEKFYKPLLTGEVKLEEIIELSNKNVQKKD